MSLKNRIENIKQTKGNDDIQEPKGFFDDVFPRLKRLNDYNMTLSKERIDNAVWHLENELEEYKSNDRTLEELQAEFVKFMNVMEGVNQCFICKHADILIQSDSIHMTGDEKKTIHRCVSFCGARNDRQLALPIVMCDLFERIQTK